MKKKNKINATYNNNSNYNPYDDLEDAPECKRVSVTHHVRNMSINDMLRKKNTELELSKNTDDEYGFGCTQLLTICPTEMLDYLFNSAVNTCFNTNKKSLPTDNFFLSCKPHEATMFFTSLTNNQQEDFCKKANAWAQNNEEFNHIMSVTINGIYLRNAQCAQIYANGIINSHPDKHIVFIANNMPARSFSVPKLVNGVMFVNNPGIAPADQKTNRLTTIDADNENKIAHMYWFNFSDIRTVCPLYQQLYLDNENNRKYTDQNGKPFRSMIDCDTSIFKIQQGDLQKEEEKKWTTEELFEEINKHEFNNSCIANYVQNNQTEFVNKLIELFSGYKFNKDNLKDLPKISNRYDVNGGDINHGRTYKGGKSNKPETEDKKKENKYMILPLQFATLIIRYWFEQDYEYRTYENFCGIIRSVLPLKIWDRFFDAQSNYSKEPAKELFNMIK